MSWVWGFTQRMGCWLFLRNDDVGLCCLQTGLIDDRLYSAILRSLEQTHCACMWFYTSDWLFHSAFYFIFIFLNIHRSGVLTALAWLVPHETAAVSAQVLCTPYNHAPCHFMQSHIREVYACLAVTCHVHVWQNDRGLLRATAVTRGWNGYRNKSQHRKSTLEKKILPPFRRGFELPTFQSRVRRSNHWAIPAPVQSVVTMGNCQRDHCLFGFSFIQGYALWSLEHDGITANSCHWWFDVWITHWER